MMDLDNLSTYEKRVCLLTVAVMRFQSDRYQAGFQKLGAVDAFEVHIFRGRHGNKGLYRSWEIKPDSTASEVADVIAQLEFLALDSPVVKVS